MKVGGTGEGQSRQEREIMQHEQRIYEGYQPARDAREKERSDRDRHSKEPAGLEGGPITEKLKKQFPTREGGQESGAGERKGNGVVYHGREVERARRGGEK